MHSNAWMHPLHFGGFLIFLCLAIYILSKNAKDQLNLSCASLLGCFSLWNFCLIFSHDPNQTRATAELFYNIGAIGWAGFASCSLWFTLVFTGRTGWLENRLIGLGMILLPVFFVGLQWMKLLAGDYTLESWGWRYVWATSIWPLLFFGYLIVFMLGGFLLIARYITTISSQNAKQQAEIIFFSGTISFVAAFLVDVALPLFGIDIIPNIAPSLAIIYAFGMVYAITKYHFALSPAEIEAQAAKEWKDTFDAIADMVSLQDANYKYLKVNKAFADFVKMKPEEIVGRTCFELIHKQGKPFPGCPHEKTLLTKKPATEEFFEPGLGIYLEVTTSPLFGKNGGVSATVHIIKDITSRKNIERELLEKREKLEATLNALPDLVFEVDRETRIYDFHSLALNLLYMAPEKFLGQKMTDVLPKEVAAVILDGIEKFLETGRQPGTQYSLKVPAGLSWFEVYYGAKGDPKDPKVHVIALIRDISKRKRLEQQKEEFMNFAAHEIRTPLAAIKQAIYLVEAGFAGPASDEQKKYLKIGRQNIDHLKDLISNFLDSEKIEAGKLQLKKVKVKLDQLIAETVETFKLQADENNVVLEGKLDLELPEINVDPERIGEVLRNLVNNAIKFSEPGGKIIISTALFSGNNKFIEVVVEDMGRGIDPKEMDQLFVKYHQLDEGKKEAAEGTGLGLVLCKEIVELHNGKIWAESEGRGKGSRFIFTLPIDA